MIIGREFVWAHLGKAGGEMTHALFNLFPDVIEFADEVHTPAQHQAFQDRADQVAGRKRVLNIRRLPSWMLSHHVWKSVYGLEPHFKPEPILSPLQIADSDVADRFLSRYRPPEDPRIDVWLRTEHIVDDFLTFIQEHADVTDAHRAAIRELPRINEVVYDKALDHWFSSAHVKLMYMRNPQWASVEAAVYGDAR